MADLQPNFAGVTQTPVTMSFIWIFSIGVSIIISTNIHKYFIIQLVHSIYKLHAC